MKTCLLNKFLTCKTSASLPLSTRSLSLTTSSSRSLSSLSPVSASRCPRLHQQTSRRQAPASTRSVARMKTEPYTISQNMYCTVLYCTVPAPPARTCTCPGSPSPAGSGPTPILGVEFKFMHNNNFPLAGQGLLWILFWQHGWTFCENKIILNRFQLEWPCLVRIRVHGWADH